MFGGAGVFRDGRNMTLLVVALMGLYHPFKFVSKASLFGLPIVGWTMRMLEYIAIERGELELHYQLQTTLADGNICGAEALMRWCQPQRGPQEWFCWRGHVRVKYRLWFLGLARRGLQPALPDEPVVDQHDRGERVNTVLGH